MARMFTRPGTLTIRTGSEISPRAKAATSFSPAIMSPATLERLGPLEAFDNFTDVFFVGIAHVLLFVLGVGGDKENSVQLEPVEVDHPDTAALPHPWTGPASFPYP